jgi:2-polyprenyl-3-methyl-5-hydroxy-6-metoxy-1,4-benzoquinol methylase
VGEARRQSIFIGVPCYGGVAPEVLEDWMRFMYHCGRRLPQYDFHLGIRTKSEQFRARNQIVDGALQTNCDWLLMLDDDMVINALVTAGPTADYGFLERLIAHDKDLCGVLYYQRGGMCPPVLMTAVGDTGYRFLYDHEVTGGLQRVDVAGGGCLLVKTRVFDHLPFPYFGPEYEYGTDVQLCRQALAKGFEVWADTSIEFGHLKQERVIVTSHNRLQHQVSDTLPGEAKKTFVAAEVYDRLVRDGCLYTGYADIEDMTRHAQGFLEQRHTSGLSDADWYRQYPRERVARQIWYNTQTPQKRTMTEYVLSAIDHHKHLDILDFGCGIGIPAFTLAEKGHRVTAIDVQGTGTLEFLKWRIRQHQVDLTIHETLGGVPHLGGAQYDAIVAMDCIEHIAEWQAVVRELAAHLKPRGVLFSNNGILEDVTHPEHYAIDNKDFIATCMASDLMPFNQITYVKRQPSVVLPSPAAKDYAHA